MLWLRRVRPLQANGNGLLPQGQKHYRTRNAKPSSSLLKGGGLRQARQSCNLEITSPGPPTRRVTGSPPTGQTPSGAPHPPRLGASQAWPQTHSYVLLEVHSCRPGEAGDSEGYHKPLAVNPLPQCTGYLPGAGDMIIRERRDADGMGGKRPRGSDESPGLTRLWVRTLPRPSPVPRQKSPGPTGDCWPQQAHSRPSRWFPLRSESQARSLTLGQCGH